MGQGIATRQTRPGVCQFMTKRSLFLMGNGAAGRSCDHLQQIGDIPAITVSHFLQGRTIGFGVDGPGVFNNCSGFVHQPVNTEQDEHATKYNNTEYGVVDLRMGIADYCRADGIMEKCRTGKQQNKWQ